jgi:peroxisomal 3,2-trans-enoyl-CoA isomerase
MATAARAPAFVRRALHASPRFLAPSAEFEAYTAAVGKLAGPAPSIDAKLAMYALYKQATVGPNTSPKPGMLDMAGRAKWGAWTALGGMSQPDAEAAYIAEARKLGARVGGGGEAPAAAAAAPVSAGSYTTISVATTPDGVRTLTMNRPDKRNAISWAMYNELSHALAAAAADDAVRVTVLTGAGPFYSAGNDLSNFLQIPPEGPGKMAENARVIMEAYVAAYVRFPKLLLAAVNGPAVGLPVTTLPLFDGVYASHTATFHAPLVSLGQTPEGCSSLTFPAVMGHARATEMLVMGRKLTAEEAVRYGLVNEVFVEGEFRARVAERAAAAAALPPLAVRRAKALLRGLPAPEAGGQVAAGRTGVAPPQLSAAALLDANAREGGVIKECWLGAEVQEAVMRFLSKGGKAGAKAA